MYGIKEIICEKLARFINDEEMQCVVLHGVDPDSGLIGRDLDVYVPQKAERTKLSSFFHQLSGRYGARWIIDMNPIWGDRSLAVWRRNYVYFELHMVSHVKLGPISATDIFSANGKTGAYGFRFSPGLSFFKEVINKNARAIITGRPIWEERRPEKFLLYFRDSYMHRQKTLLFINEKFITALLDEDNDGNRKQRRYGFLFMILSYTVHHPINAIFSYAKSVFRKFAIYWSPCVPIVILATNLSVAQLREGLKQRLGSVFPKIVVSRSKRFWMFRRKMQARQQLFVLVSLDVKKRLLKAELKLDTRCLSTNEKELDVLCNSIMDAMVGINARWSVKITSQ